MDYRPLIALFLMVSACSERDKDPASPGGDTGASGTDDVDSGEATDGGTTDGGTTDGSVSTDSGATGPIDEDGDGSPADEDCDDTDATAYPGATELWYDGIDQDCAGGDDFDADADGYQSAGHGGTDCLDSDAAVFPGATEVWYDGVDQDCDGNDADADGDGFAATAAGGGDCDDVDPDVHPDAVEAWYDGIDTDCDGADDYDADGDGFGSDAFGGTDCDDGAASISPGAAETWYDGVDADCDGASDFDADGDGFDSDAHAGHDCDDGDADVWPGATDAWYDGVDADCDGADDYDADADGYRSDAHGGDDCDDALAEVHPDAADGWYDGVDADCDGADDYDADGDGYRSDAHGGTDCDDADDGLHPGAEDAWYDGIDADCAGDDDYDADGDGYRAVAHDGEDCDDGDDSVRPDAVELWYDGVDSDCDGASDYDRDGDGADAVDYGGTDCDDGDDGVVARTWYDDADGDGFGDPYETSSECDAPDGFVAVAGDCDDTEPLVHPDMPELFGNDADDDCSGALDDNEADPDTLLADFETYASGIEGASGLTWNRWLYTYADTDGSAWAEQNDTVETYDDACDVLFYEINDETGACNEVTDGRSEHDELCQVTDAGPLHYTVPLEWDFDTPDCTETLSDLNSTIYHRARRRYEEGAPTWSCALVYVPDYDGASANPVEARAGRDCTPNYWNPGTGIVDLFTAEASTPVPENEWTWLCLTPDSTFGVDAFSGFDPDGELLDDDVVVPDGHPYCTGWFQAANCEVVETSGSDGPAWDCEHFDTQGEFFVAGLVFAGDGDTIDLSLEVESCDEDCELYLWAEEDAGPHGPTSVSGSTAVWDLEDLYGARHAEGELFGLGYDAEYAYTVIGIEAEVDGYLAGGALSDWTQAALYAPATWHLTRDGTSASLEVDCAHHSWKGTYFSTSLTLDNDDPAIAAGGDWPADDCEDYGTGTGLELEVDGCDEDCCLWHSLNAGATWGADGAPDRWGDGSASWFIEPSALADAPGVFSSTRSFTVELDGCGSSSGRFLLDGTRSTGASYVTSARWHTRHGGRVDTTEVDCSFVSPLTGDAYGFQLDIAVSEDSVEGVGTWSGACDDP